MLHTLCVFPKAPRATRFEVRKGYFRFMQLRIPLADVLHSERRLAEYVIVKSLAFMTNAFDEQLR